MAALNFYMARFFVPEWSPNVLKKVKVRIGHEDYLVNETDDDDLVQNVAMH